MSTLEIAIIRGPYFRPNSTFLWEFLHNEYEEVKVTGFESDPSWFDPSVLELPIESLDWWDGKIDAFGYENILYQALEKYRLPSIALSGIREIVDEHDAVHVTENYRLYAYYAALLCSRTETELFVDVHENIPHRPANPVTWYVKRTVNRNASAFTSPTVASQRALVHEGVDPERVQILPNVVDTDRFDTGPKDAESTSLPNRLESTFNILFVHGLNEQKGTHYLLGAFEQVRERFDDVSLILVGENSLDTDVYAAAVAGNPDVYHVEYIPEIRHLYNLSDVFVLPSIATPRWKEQFGRVIIEAMACGLPTVVTNVGGPPHVVAEGYTSLVVESRSSEALYDALHELIVNDECRDELGANAYDYVRENYVPEVVGPDLYDLYCSHLKE